MMRTQLLPNPCLTNSILFGISGLIAIKPYVTAYIYIALCDLKLKIPRHNGLRGERRYPGVCMKAMEAFALNVLSC